SSSDLEAFGHNLTDDSFGPLLAQTGLNTNYSDEPWVNNPTLTEFCVSKIGRADIEGLRINKQHRYERLPATSRLSLDVVP
ncbi:MAG: hypothetical protein J3R72DRAFT_370828, partial [Linnemannia gamsii]